MNASSLREALARIMDNFRMSAEVGIPIVRESEWEIAFKAAEERLAQLEADPELVERIAIQLLSFNLVAGADADDVWGQSSPFFKEGFLLKVKEILAALTPPALEEL